MSETLFTTVLLLTLVMGTRHFPAPPLGIWWTG